MTYPQQPGNWSDPTGQPAPTEPSPYAAEPSPYATEPSPYAAQPSGPPLPPPAYPQYGYPMVVAAPPTNGLAIASLVVSLVGVFGLCGYGLGGYIGIVGAILGHVGRRQIRERGEGGDGLALAGVIVGWITAGIAVAATILIVVLIVVAVNSDSSNDYSDYLHMLMQQVG